MCRVRPWERYTFKVIGDGLNASELRQRDEAVFGRIRAQMSSWLTDSEISRFNSIRTSDWTKISDEFILVNPLVKIIPE